MKSYKGVFGLSFKMSNFKKKDNFKKVEVVW